MGVAKAPCSLAGSWRAGWTLTSLPSIDSCTDPATKVTVTWWRAHIRPARYMAPAKLIEPLPSAMRSTEGPAAGRRALGAIDGCRFGRSFWAGRRCT